MQRTRPSPSRSSALTVFLVVGFVAALVLASYSSVLAQTRPESQTKLRAASVPTFSGYIGYDGNAAIYPTVSVYQPRYALPGFNLTSYQTTKNSTNSGIANVLNFLTSTYGGELPDYAYVPALGNLFVVSAYLGALSGSKAWSTCEGVDCNYQVDYYTDAQEVSETPSSNLPAAATTEFYEGNDTGLNVTQPSSHGTGTLPLGFLSLGLDIGSILFPELTGIALASIALDLASLLANGDACWNIEPNGPNHCSSLGPNDDNAGATQWGEVVDGSGPGLAPTNGQNVFDQSMLVWYFIPQASLSSIPSGGTLTYSAHNELELENTETGGVTTSVGASASSSYQFEPAVAIGGYVDVTGTTPATNLDGFSDPVTVTLAQTCPAGTTDFTDIPLASNGSWQFFADPGCTYTSQAVFSATPLGTYTTPSYQIPTADTDPSSGTSAGQAFDNAVNMSLGLGHVSGKITNACTGLNVNPALVSIWQAGYTGYGQVQDGSGGNYGPLYFPVTADYYLVAGYETTYVEDEIEPAFTAGDSYTENFALTPTGGCGGGGGGGGGCVVYGTPILTPRGYVPIQKLASGSTLYEFNLSEGRLITGTLESASVSTASEYLDVNNGLLESTLTDQPIYIRNATFEGWLHNPLNLTYADQLFDAVTDSWVNVTSLVIVATSAQTYDVVTSGANNFVADSILLDIKEP